MIIDKNLNKYIILAEDNILQALQKISANKNRIIFSYIIYIIFSIIMYTPLIQKKANGFNRET